MKQLLKIFSLYLSVVVIFFIIYVLLFSTPLFKNISILFYRGISLLVFEIILAFILTIYLHLRKKANIESIFASIAVAASFCLVFLTLIPVTVDRSISTYLLNVIDNPRRVCVDGGITKEDLKQDFLKEYFGSSDAIGRRLIEQQTTGTVYENNAKCWQLTPKGKRLVMFFNVIKNYFSPLTE